MTRLTRLSAAAQAHYVVLRSVPEISLIPFDKNIEKLFQIFSDGSRAYSTDISAFAVFTDQIHLLLTPREKAEDLSRFVQQLSRLYSHYFNDEFSRNGKIWQGRFESSLLQGKGRLLAATIYMAWLPFVYGYGEPQFYPWSSYFHHAGIRSDYFMVPSIEYWALGNTPFERQKNYKDLFERGPDKVFGERLMSCVKRGWPIADKKFLESIGVEAERMEPQRGRGRPRKASAINPLESDTNLLNK